MNTRPLSSASAAVRIERFGAGLVRWSLVFFLVFFGALKWTADEAQAIHPLISHSPFLSWLDAALGAQGASEVVGVIELATALLIVLRHWAPRLTIAGGAMGVLMFLTTLSFLVTTPNLGEMSGFLLKDLTLLGAAFWIAGEAAVAATRQMSTPGGD